MPAWLRLTCVLTFIAGCQRDNPYFCENAPHHNCLALDAFTGCNNNQDCTGPTAVCDLIPRMCVECTATEHDACRDQKPVCGNDDACRGCMAHAECSSNACLPSGACGTNANVAYVDPGGTDNDSCTLAMPCTKVSKALATKRDFVKFHGTTDEAVTVKNGQVVTFVADPGALLTRGTGSGTGAIITLQDNVTSLSIYDLSVSNAPNNPSGIGCVIPAGGGAPTLSLTRVKLINNPGGGVSASGGTLTVTGSTISGSQAAGISASGGTLTVTQTSVDSNQGAGVSITGGSLTVSQCTLSSNSGGGILVSGAGSTFDITNNFMFRNGDPDNGTFGGVNLAIATASNSRLEFNTIADNRSAINSGGVVCNITGFTAPNNIVARNSLGMSTTAANAQTSGACTYPSSKVQNDVSGLGFVDSEAPAPFDYRITSTSSAIGQALTPSTIGVDHDGDMRPQGTQKDIGADEFKAGQ